MSWILFIAFGFVVGLLARLLVPGKQSLGLLWTTVLGVAGALLGGFIVSGFTGTGVTDINVWSFIGAVAGAVVLLLGYIAFTRSKGGGITRHRGHAH